MKIVDVGRMTFPAGAGTAKRFAMRHLLSIHGRLGAIRALMGSPPIRGTTRHVDEGPLDLALGDWACGEVRGALERWIGVSRPDWLLLRDYDDGTRNRNVLFLFGANGELAAAAKIRSGFSSGAPLQAEAAILQDLREGLPPAIAEPLPTVLEIVHGPTAEVLVLSPLPGRPLSISMQRSLRPHAAHERHLIAAGAWLGAFHRATAEESLLGRVIETTAVHGDFWPRNLLFARGGGLSGVIDWEDGAASGPFWRDLFTLPFLFAVAPRAWAEGSREAFRRAFLDETRLRRAVGAYFEAYARAAGIESARFPTLFEAFLLDSVHLARKEEGRWRSRYPWRELLRMFSEASRSVFSG